jgi:hypothetical protein
LFFLALTLLLWSAVNLKAQVNIGSLDAPHTGAILDLSQGASDRGILLPHVFITNVKSFQLETNATSTIANAIGMVVYNTNPALGEGLYTWNGTEWKSVGSGSSGNCTPVTATSSSSKTGSNTTLKVEVSAGSPVFTYTWYKSGVNGSIRTVSNATATSDTYTTAAAGTYTCQVVNTCTTTPASFTFIIGTDGNSDSYVDNGNGTYTDNDGNLVVIGEDGTKEVYTKVDSDIPGIYLDKDGEIVYTGADGIPGTADDDVFVEPLKPLPLQETFFSILSPSTIFVNSVLPIVLDFAEGPGSYTGKIKYVSSNPSVIAVDADGVMTTGPTVGETAIIAIILEDGSIGRTTCYLRSASPANNVKLDRVEDKSNTFSPGLVKKIGASLTDRDGFVNAWNIKKVTYAIANDDDGTGSTITEGGWFHAGTPGTVTVTATAEAFENGSSGSTYTKAGTITVTILDAPTPEAQPYVTSSTDWNNLDPAPAYAGGDGTASNPYLISSVRQLKKLSIDMKLLGSVEATYQKYFELTADFDFSADDTVKEYLFGTFYGNLDGKGHVIKDLDVNTTGMFSIFNGLAYGEIKNLGREGGSLIGATINSASGLILTLGNEGKVANCYNSSSIDILTGAGGLIYNTSNAAGNVSAIIENCYNRGNITSAGPSGGLVAACLTGGAELSITNSYNAGEINGTVAGGLIAGVNGALTDKRTLNMNNCFNFGSVGITANDENVGSVLGRILNGNELLKVNATNVYSRPEAASANNGSIVKARPIGWANIAAKNYVDNIVIPTNPTLKEDAKYTLNYSQSAAFVTELGGAFKFANGRTPKLAWEAE